MEFSLPAVQGGLGTFFQRRAIPDPALARVAGQFEILREFERIGGTRVFAQSAEHTAAQIVSEVGQLFAAGFFVAFARDHDQVLGARQRAKVARNAHGLVRVGVHVEPRRSSVALRNLRPLQRILLGVDLLGILIAKGDLQPLKEVDQEDFAEQARHAHDGVSISPKSRFPKPCGSNKTIKDVLCVPLCPLW